MKAGLVPRPVSFFTYRRASVATGTRIFYGVFTAIGGENEQPSRCDELYQGENTFRSQHELAVLRAEEIPQDFSLTLTTHHKYRLAIVDNGALP